MYVVVIWAISVSAGRWRGLVATLGMIRGVSRYLWQSISILIMNGISKGQSLFIFRVIFHTSSSQISAFSVKFAGSDGLSSKGTISSVTEMAFLLSALILSPRNHVVVIYLYPALIAMKFHTFIDTSIYYIGTKGQHLQTLQMSYMSNSTVMCNFHLSWVIWLAWGDGNLSNFMKQNNENYTSESNAYCI